MVVTNMAGVAFAATLIAASDPGATFVFPEDGATNVLSWTQLAPPSREAVCAAIGFEPVPPELAATFALVRKELRRLAALEADRRLPADEAGARRVRMREAFVKRCGRAGLDERKTDRLLRRLTAP